MLKKQGCGRKITIALSILALNTFQVGTYYPSSSKNFAITLGCLVSAARSSLTSSGKSTGDKTLAGQKSWPEKSILSQVTDGMENNVPTLQAIKVKGGLPVMLMYPVRVRNVPLRIQTTVQFYTYRTSPRWCHLSWTTLPWWRLRLSSLTPSNRRAALWRRPFQGWSAPVVFLPIDEGRRKKTNNTSPNLKETSIEVSA